MDVRMKPKPFPFGWKFVLEGLVCQLLVALSYPGALAAADSKATDAAPLYAGWATVDITPPKPVALVGQLHKRISDGVRDPLTATVLALESAGGDKPEQAILVSCDLLFILREVQQQLQNRVRMLMPEIDSA